MRRFSAITALAAAFAGVLVSVSGAAFATDTPAAATEASAAPPKRLHSIPLDGALEDVPVAPRVVRELTALRPKDDLIICIAGCSPGRDLIIYSKPQEELVDGKSVTNNVPIKAAPTMDTPNIDGPAAAVKPEVKVDAEKQAKAVPGDDASMPDVINAQPEGDVVGGNGATSAFEPTVDLPKGAVGDDVASDAAVSEPSSDPEPVPLDRPATEENNR